MHDFDELYAHCRSAAGTAVSLLPDGPTSDAFSVAEAILRAVDATVPSLAEVDVPWFLRMLHAQPQLFLRDVDATNVREACREAVVDTIIEQLENADWTADPDASGPAIR